MHLYLVERLTAEALKQTVDSLYLLSLEATFRVGVGAQLGQLADVKCLINEVIMCPVGQINVLSATWADLYVLLRQPWHLMGG